MRLPHMPEPARRCLRPICRSRSGANCWSLSPIFTKPQAGLPGMPGCAIVPANTTPTELTRAMLEYDSAWALARIGLAEEAIAALRRARDAHQGGAEEPRPWDHFAITLPHVEGCTQLAPLQQAAAAARTRRAAISPRSWQP